MSYNLFTYGSLMFAPVWKRVVQGDYRSAPATLIDHARYVVPGMTYPGMVPQTGAMVQGILYFDVSAEDMAFLDAFEGSDYRRSIVQVNAAGAGMQAAAAYIWLDRSRLAATPWDPQSFAIREFMNTYCMDNLQN